MLGHGYRALQSSLEMRRQAAWDRARHEQNQRDEYTSKIRFGAVAFNAVSLATVLNLLPIIPGLSFAEAATGAAFFFAGAIAGGASLLSHQTQLIRTANKATLLAMNLERALMFSGFPPESPEYAQLGKVLDEIDAVLEDDFYETGTTAIAAQHASLSLWAVGALVLGLTQVADLLPFFG